MKKSSNVGGGAQGAAAMNENLNSININGQTFASE